MAITVEGNTGMTTHTPGPWKWGPKINAICGDGMWFAKIAWTVREPRNEADARLIAAAPDMLAALKVIMAEPHGCVFCDSGKLRNPNKPHEPDCGFELAGTAISRAES